MVIAGSFAKVPVNLKHTCKHCLTLVAESSDRDEDNNLDNSIYHLLFSHLRGNTSNLATIEKDFEVGRLHHPKHPPQPVKRPPKPTKPHR
jgi:hypothetical protein